jgi:hypothetical protein
MDRASFCVVLISYGDVICPYAVVSDVLSVNYVILVPMLARALELATVQILTLYLYVGLLVRCVCLCVCVTLWLLFSRSLCVSFGQDMMCVSSQGA